MGWTIMQMERVEKGYCVRCGEDAAILGKFECARCLNDRRQEKRRAYCQAKIDSYAISISDKNRVAELFEDFGFEARPELVIDVAKLEKADKPRSIFFWYLFRSKRWTIGKYTDQSIIVSDLNELIGDCLNYAQTIPDPIKEMRDLQQERQIETHDRSITALAMAHMDGMTSDDFAAVNHLY